MNDDDLLFDDETPCESSTIILSPLRWKMLVVDDEPEVHSITRMVLADFVFRDRSAQIFSAYSAAEAIQCLQREPEIALILLDVVMETDDAGLRLVRHIREVMGNMYVRIILRTGQPGQAPERNVILEYDINDYKAKTQLTAQQLYTCTVAALRSYQDLITIDANRRGLEKIIEAASSLYKTRSMKLFAAGILTQLCALVGASPDALLCLRRTNSPTLHILVGSGQFESLSDEPFDDRVAADIHTAINTCLNTQTNHFGRTYSTTHIRTLSGHEAVAYLRSDCPINKLGQRLIELFCNNISMGFENIYLHEQLMEAMAGTLPKEGKE